jgi:hypothetical protein
VSFDVKKQQVMESSSLIGTTKPKLPLAATKYN